jgi:hypothetical protein
MILFPKEFEPRSVAAKRERSSAASSFHLLVPLIAATDFSMLHAIAVFVRGS